jgi:hypothetical protein
VTAVFVHFLDAPVVSVLPVAGDLGPQIVGFGADAGSSFVIDNTPTGGRGASVSPRCELQLPYSNLTRPSNPA